MKTGCVLCLDTHTFVCVAKTCACTGMSDSGCVSSTGISKSKMGFSVKKTKQKNYYLTTVGQKQPLRKHVFATNVASRPHTLHERTISFRNN